MTVRAWSVAVFLLAGCQGFQPIVLTEDLGVGGEEDLAVPSDLSASDLSGADLATEDLAHTPVWTDISPAVSVGRLNAVCGRSATQIFAVGSNGVILRSDDAGTHWMTVTSGTTQELFAIFCDATAIYAVGEGLTILRSTDGTNFSPQMMNIGADLGVPPTLQGVWGVGADYFVVGSPGLILHSNNAGQDWDTQMSSFSYDFRTVAGTSASDIYVGGLEHQVFDQPVIFHSDNAGMMWTQQTTPTANNQGIRAIRAVNTTDVFAVGSGPGSALCLHTTNGGLTWNPQATGAQGGLENVWAFSASSALITGSDGEVFRTVNAGTDWTLETVPTTGDLYGLWAADAANVFAVGFAFGPTGGSRAIRYQ